MYMRGDDAIIIIISAVKHVMYKRGDNAIIIILSHYNMQSLIINKYL